MPPRFIQRLERQSQAYRDIFGGEPQFDPPPYPISRSSSLSEASQQTPPPQYSQIHSPRRSSLERSSLPNNSLILVTGANGWQGIHVVDQLLSVGFRVRGSVRDPDSAIWTSRFFREKYGAGRYTTAIIPDMVPKGAFDIAVNGCSGVIHCASVTKYSPDPTQVITPSIAGAINALEAAEREPQVQRFIYCSSTAAAAAGAASGTRSDVTSDSWNMSAFLNAWAKPPYEADRIWAVHASCKLQTEQAVWRWYSDRRPHFVMNTVLPGVLWGRVLDPEHQGFPSTVGLLKVIWDGNAAATAFVPPQHFIDVQDSALLHVAALLLEDVQNRRIFAVNSPFNLNSILLLLRALYPERVFPGDVDHGADMTVFKEADYAESLLHRMGKKGFTDIETSLQRTCEAFL